MNEEKIVDVWTLFKEYVDKKQLEVVAEKFIDLMADYGVDDETLKESLGVDSVLDEAIYYYLDLDADSYDNEDEEWDE
jgi:hypothetical protein